MKNILQEHSYNYRSRTKFKNKIRNIMQKKREGKKSYLNLIASKVEKRKEKINP